MYSGRAFAEPAPTQEDGPELLEDQLLSSYLEYSVGQPRLGTRSSSRAEEMVLSNVEFLVDSGTLAPIHIDTARYEMRSISFFFFNFFLS